MFVLICKMLPFGFNDPIELSMRSLLISVPKSAFREIHRWRNKPLGKVFLD